MKNAVKKQIMEQVGQAEQTAAAKIILPLVGKDFGNFHREESMSPPSFVRMEPRSKD